MHRAADVVIVVDVINVNLVAIVPAWRQRTRKREPVSVILKARMARNVDRTHDHKPVFAAKMHAEVVFRNTAMVMFLVFFIANVVLIAFVMPIPVFVFFMSVGVASSVIARPVAIIVPVSFMPVAVMIMLCKRRY